MHILLEERVVRVFTDLPCTTCEADAGLPDAATDADVVPAADGGDAGASEGDAGDAGRKPEVPFTPPGAGEARLLLVLELSVPEERGVYDLSTLEGSDVVSCSRGYLVETPRLGCADRRGRLHPADRARVAGSLTVDTDHDVLDAVFAGRGRVRLTRVTTRTPYRPGSPYTECL